MTDALTTILAVTLTCVLTVVKPYVYMGVLANGETQRARKIKNPKATWKWALGDLALGGRSIECVRAFDRLTNDMYRADLVSFDEFLAAQTVIAAAYAGAKQLQKVAA